GYRRHSRYLPSGRTAHCRRDARYARGRDQSAGTSFCHGPRVAGGPARSDPPHGNPWRLCRVPGGRLYYLLGECLARAGEGEGGVMAQQTMNTSPKTPHPIAPLLLQNPKLQLVLSILHANGEEARIVGGALRDAILGQRTIPDVDLATTAVPEDVMARAES